MLIFKSTFVYKLTFIQSFYRFRIYFFFVFVVSGSFTEEAEDGTWATWLMGRLPLVIVVDATCSFIAIISLLWFWGFISSSPSSSSISIEIVTRSGLFPRFVTFLLGSTLQPPDLIWSLLSPFALVKYPLSANSFVWF